MVDIECVSVVCIELSILYVVIIGTMVDIECGSDGCQTSGFENRECFPMSIPNDDTFFKQDCLMFVRSQAFFKDKCQIGKYTLSMYLC